jgi:hypothetical protein
MDHCIDMEQHTGIHEIKVQQDVRNSCMKNVESEKYIPEASIFGCEFDETNMRIFNNT